MKRTLRYGLLAGASGLALSIALTGTSALAFNKDLDWEWENKVETEFKFDPRYDINDEWDIFPEGLVMVEAIQIQLGDVKATSKVWNVSNHQHGEKQAAEDIHFKFQGENFDNTASELNGETYGGSTEQQEGFGHGTDTYETGTTFGSGSEFSNDVDDVDWGFHNVTGVKGDPDDAINVIGGTADGETCTNEDGGDEAGCVVFEVTIDADAIKWIPVNTFNAVTQLPEVVSAATAVANNYSTTADAGTLLHIGQYAAESEGGEDLDGEIELYDDDSDAEIEFENAELKQGDVEAESYVWDIWNASVDSSATAISNNISVSVNPEDAVEAYDGQGNAIDVYDEDGEAIDLSQSDFVPDDHLLIADFTQFSYMDVTSNSWVTDVDVNNYSNLGKMDRPLVNSTATSIGNNISVNVGN